MGRDGGDATADGSREDAEEPEGPSPAAARVGAGAVGREAAKTG